MRGIKVLPFNCSDYWLEELIEEYMECNVEIAPVFNRNGRYFDRLKDCCWIEIEGRAWLEDSSTMFKFELESLNHEERPLTNDCLQSIHKLLFHYGIKSKKLRKLYYNDLHRRDIQNIRKEAVLYRLRFDKNKLEK